jgi:hypothetical protein
MNISSLQHGRGRSAQRPLGLGLNPFIFLFNVRDASLRFAGHWNSCQAVHGLTNRQRPIHERPEITRILKLENGASLLRPTVVVLVSHLASAGIDT